MKYRIELEVEIDEDAWCDVSCPEEVKWFEDTVLQELRLFWSDEDFLSEGFAKTISIKKQGENID